MSLFNGDCRLRICELKSGRWGEKDPGVNRWLELGSLEPDAIEERTEAKFVPMTELRHIAPRPSNESSPSLKYHTIGFQYVGPRLTVEALAASAVKEAYGVAQGAGVQSVLVVLEKSHGVRADHCGMVPYRLGLVSQWIKISDVRVYKKQSVEVDDPILNAIKQPDENKWIWWKPKSPRAPKKISRCLCLV